MPGQTYQINRHVHVTCLNPKPAPLISYELAIHPIPGTPKP